MAEAKRIRLKPNIPILETENGSPVMELVVSLNVKYFIFYFFTFQRRKWMREPDGEGTGGGHEWAA